MNIANIEKLIDHLEATKAVTLGDRSGMPLFDLSSWAFGVPDVILQKHDGKDGDELEKWAIHPNCETVACIAGHAVFALDEPFYNELKQHAIVVGRSSEVYKIARKAEELLDLPNDVASGLFTPAAMFVNEEQQKYRGWSYSHVTIDDAIQALHNVMNGAITSSEIWAHMDEKYKGPSPETPEVA